MNTIRRYTPIHAAIDWVIGTILFNRLVISIEGGYARTIGRSMGTEFTFQISMVLALLFGGVMLIRLSRYGYAKSKATGEGVRIIAVVTAVLLIPVSFSLM